MNLVINNRKKKTTKLLLHPVYQDPDEEPDEPDYPEPELPPYPELEPNEVPKENPAVRPPVEIPLSRKKEVSSCV